jgi:hypothetical protein
MTPCSVMPTSDAIEASETPRVPCVAKTRVAASRICSRRARPFLVFGSGRMPRI